MSGQLHTIDKRRLIRDPMIRLSDPLIAKVAEAIHEILELVED